MIWLKDIRGQPFLGSPGTTRRSRARLGYNSRVCPYPWNCHAPQIFWRAGPARPTTVKLASLPRWLALIALVGATLLWWWPGALGLTEPARQAASLTLAAVALWATGSLPEHLVSIGFLLLAMLGEVAPADAVFAGFQSGALWLVFSGLVIGAAVNRTGLGARLARRVLGLAGARYPGIIATVVLVGVLLALLMPSTMGRIVLLIPVMAALAGRLGFAPGSRGHAGIMLAATLGTFMPGAAILPAIVPNMILTGVAETVHEVEFIYGSYLLLHGPVTGLLKALAIIGLTVWLFHDKPTPREQNLAVEPLRPDETRLLLILLGALGFWATDFLHGISPAWVALGAAFLCLLPGVGMIPVPAFDREISFRPLFYVGGILGIGAVLVSTGLSERLGETLLAVAKLEPGQPVRSFAVLVVMATLLGLVGTVATIPVVFGPIADKLAAAAGLPLETVLMIPVIGYSTALLPYTVGPVYVAMQLGKVRLADGTRLLLALAFVTLAVLTPLNYLWWRWLGYLD